jgi:hypothetical protein
MTELRCYSVEAVAGSAAEPGAVFRDRQGAYWRSRTGGGWLTWQGSWVSSEPPTTLLEGPADLLDTSAARTAEPPPDDGGTGAPGPAQLILLVDGMRARYESGNLTSDDVASGLGRVSLVDDEGAAWSLGFRSNAWYRFTGGRWSEAGEPPDPERLLSAGELLGGHCASCGAAAEGRPFCGDCGAKLLPSRLNAAIGAAMAAFLEHGYGALPEPVTEPWSPPPVEEQTATPPPTAAVSSAAVSAAPVLPAAVRPAPRRGFALRRLGGAISTVLGIALLVFSVGRVLAGMGGSPGPTDRPVVPTDAPLVTPAPTPADVTPEPTPLPTEGASPASTSASSETRFADAFDTEAAWFVGEGEYFTTAVVEGLYAIEVRPTDLPTFLWAASEGPMGDAATIEATVLFAPQPLSTEAGIVAQAADLGTRLIFVVSPGGSWALYQDDTESFRTLLQGTSTLLRAEDPLRLRMDIGATSVAVSVNDTRLDTADVSITLASFGIALRATEATGYVAFDEYKVSVPGR